MSEQRVNPVLFSLLSLGWLALVWLISSRIGDNGLWLAGVGILVLALPVVAVSLYISTVNKILRSHAYRAHSLLRWLNSGRLVPTIAWTLISVVVGCCSLFLFTQLSSLEWVFVVLTGPLYLLLLRACQRLFASQYVGYVALARSLAMSRYIYAALAAVLFGLLSLSTADTEPLQRPSELLDADQSLTLQSRSYFVHYGTRYAEFYHQFKALALSSIDDMGDLLSLTVAVLGIFGMFFSVSSAFSAFCLTPAELRRLFQPVQAVDVPQKPDNSRIVVFSAVVTILLVFIYLPLIAALESRLAADTGLREKIAAAEAAARPHVERIEDRIYSAGTIAEIRELQIGLLAQYEANLRSLAPLADRGFDKMQANVELYLDWYYSLPAEYLRLAALMTSSLEDSITGDLTAYLEEGDPLAELERAMDQMVVKNELLKARFDAAVEQVMKNNEVVAEAPHIRVLESVSLAEMMSPLSGVDVIGVEWRATGAGVGAVSSVVAAKVVGKTAAKGTVKLAAKAVSKAMLSKSVSAGAGAGTGALIGSVVPGPGTLLGAVIGATIGLVAGVTVDALLLRIEEVISREDFRREILAALEERRLELYAGLGLWDPRNPDSAENSVQQ